MSDSEIREIILRQAVRLKIDPLRVHPLTIGGAGSAERDSVDLFIDDTMRVKGTVEEVLTLLREATDEADLIRRGVSTLPKR